LSAEVSTAVISGLIALVIATIGAVVNLGQLRRERDRWLVDAKMSWTNELYKVRLARYPAAFEILRSLSHGNTTALTPQIAGAVALDLNEWFYSAGGMAADATTRGAILGLRQACAGWAREGGKRPRELMAFRNLAIQCLRRDIDLHGNEKYDFDQPATMLASLRQELQRERHR
jgi:hypothetical protein